MGACARRTILAISIISIKGERKKSDFRAAKKSGKKSNPVKQSFAQLSKKSD
jgi:hypothetical protein